MEITGYKTLYGDFSDTDNSNRNNNAVKKKTLTVITIAEKVEIDYSEPEDFPQSSGNCHTIPAPPVAGVPVICAVDDDGERYMIESVNASVGDKLIINE